MEEFIKIENLIDHSKDYLNTRVDEIKLTVVEKTSDVLSEVIAGAIVTLVFAFCVLFASVAAAYGLALWTGKTWLGFLIVAGLYFLLGWIVWGARNRLIRLPIMNSLIHQLFNNRIEDEED